MTGRPAAIPAIALLRRVEMPLRTKRRTSAPGQPIYDLLRLNDTLDG